MWLTRISVNNPVFAVMLMLALMVVGLAAISRMQVEEFPDIDFPFVVVNTVYAGASPEVVESDITKKIEDEINTISGVKQVTSISQEGMSQVIVEFTLTTSSDIAAQKVRDKLAMVTPTFRDEVSDPVIAQYNPADVPVVSVTFESNSMSMRDLSTYLKNSVTKQLQTVQGVGRVDMLGNRERQIRVVISPDKLSAYHVSINQVINALKSENVQIPVGNITQDSQEMVVQIDGQFASPQDFNQLIVAQNANGVGQSYPVYLSQVAQVMDSQTEAASASLQNGNPAVAMDIIKTSDANVIDVVNHTQARLEEIKQSLPAGVTMTVVADTSKSIRASLNNVVHTLIEGALLAVLIVWLFLGSWRSTVITGMTLPISLLGTLAAIWVFGFSINMMTLLALALCIGLLIDDAIVVRENIVRHAAMGKGHKQAALDGTQEIGLAVLATTLVIVAVFLPVAFMGGIIGRFFYQFGVTVSAAVLLSMFVSFTLDPMLSSIWKDPQAQHQYDPNKRVDFRRHPIAWMLHGFQILLDKITHIYVKLLKWSLVHRLMTMGIAILSLIGAFFVVGLIGKEFVPPTDTNQLKVKFETPINASLDYTEKKAAQVNGILRQYPEVTNTYATINAVGYSGKNKVQVQVNLLPKDARNKDMITLSRDMREQLKRVGGIEVTSVAAAAQAVTGGLKPIMISIKGDDLTKLQSLSNDFMQRLSKVNGIVDLESSLKQPKSLVSLHINRAAASDAGLSIGQIGQALRPLLAGDNVTTFKDAQGNNIDVNVRLSDDNRQTIGQLKSIYLSSSKIDPVIGQPILVPLSQVAGFSEELGAAQINRRDLFREVMIQANTDGRPAGDIGDDIKKIQADMKLPAGYQFVVQGANKDMAESIGYATTALLLAVVFIYMLLGSQFNSFLYPVAIMASLPLSLIGVFFSLFIFGSTLNIFSIIGIIMLMGLVCKNAILLIDFIKQSLQEGMSRQQAIMTAGETRLRPILMTTAAMVVGMIPLALGLGEGSEQQAPMAHAIIGGVLTSTLLTLVVVPVIYTYLDDMKHWVFRYLNHKSNTNKVG